MDTNNAATKEVATPSAVPQPITGRRIDRTAALQILSSRTTIKVEHIGAEVKLLVQGNGQFLPKGHKFTIAGESTERENGFDRTIYGLKANSAVLMQEPDNKQLFADALDLQAAGKFDEAHAKYNEYLNAVQISFSVGVPSTRMFHNGDTVKGKIELVATKAGKQRLVINDVYYVAPIAIAKTTFDVDDLINA